MTNTSTITITNVHDIKSGDKLSFSVPDTRKWKRLWYFVTFRKNPMVVEYFKVESVESRTSIKISPWKN